MFLTRNEQPYWSAKLVGSQLVRYDMIGAGFYNLCQRLERAGKVATRRPFKVARKTSPSLLTASPAYWHCGIHFLANVPSGIIAKHYIRPDQKTFDEAVAWLGTQYGVC